VGVVLVLVVELRDCVVLCTGVDEGVLTLGVLDCLLQRLLERLPLTLGVVRVVEDRAAVPQIQGQLGRFDERGGERLLLGEAPLTVALDEAEVLAVPRLLVLVAPVLVLEVGVALALLLEGLVDLDVDRPEGAAGPCSSASSPAAPLIRSRAVR
jgi:hypothetical protein